MNLTRVRFVLGAMCVTLCAASSASAQVFGTFAWQMQPYCNIVSLTLSSSPAGFVLEGTDNQCGAVDKASAMGVASFNANGLVNLNFTIVTAPGGKAVHVAAVVNPGTGNGTWTDSVGNTGSFALGAPGGGSPRPLPASGIGVASITSVEIAPGAVGGGDINTAEVQARVSGTCPTGQSVTGVNQDGTVVCAAPAITTAQIAPGAVGGNEINTAEVQVRVSGTCPAGQSATGVNQNGTVICAAPVVTTAEIVPGAVGGSDINTAEVQVRVSGTCPAGESVTGVNQNGTVVCAAPTFAAAALECTTVSGTPTSVAAGAYASLPTLFCPAVHTPISLAISAGENVLVADSYTAGNAGQIFVRSLSANTQNVTAKLICCRVPGR